MKREESLGYQVNHLARLMELRLRDRIAATGVVPGQFAQLLALFEEDGLSQRELGLRVQVDPSTMAHTLRRMERDGLVQRDVDPADRRRVVVTLTDHARSLEATLTAAAEETNAEATRSLSPTEQGRLLKLVGSVIAQLQSDDASEVQ
ncbi:MarR family winged helix-turn-helix transcriptional regulator [Microbacterium sp. MPKO10]|uniref:MarR family winged helix-turn-helix transcriptional regulator n=1 Tax=Microbacterium sp. MPKO10 TaxID=2989818 RepID=UPI002235C930|nr:MarR family transcriptional regulator [Microbacterium sp. MPKO10]MCW4457357.1 MarR family transcriptional regulator [Microbacterium sp. MPKO10]